MAAPVSRCDCGAPLSPHDIPGADYCAECMQHQADLPSILDDPEALECEWCGGEAEEDELDEDGRCSACLESLDDRRQLESDYRFWTR